jgi:hypothetical protein
MSYSEGQEFIGIYPPEAAIFATQNGLKIVEAGSRGSKTVYKLVREGKTVEDLKRDIKNAFKSLQKEDSNAMIVVKGMRVNANRISLERAQILLDDFDEHSTMGSLIFIDYDNKKQMISKEDLQNIIKAIKKFQVFIVQRKAELLESVNNMTDAEVQTFNVQDAFSFEV